MVTRRTAKAKMVSNLELQTATRLSVLCRRQLCQHIRASLPEPWMPTCLIAITVDEGAEAVPFSELHNVMTGRIASIRRQWTIVGASAPGGRVAQSR